MAVDFAFIRAVLEEHEGKAAPQGYVPQDRHGKVLGVSGVTVGTGVDLGQQTRRGLHSLGLPDALLDKLEPYLGFKKEAALALLRDKPLRLSPAETAALDEAIGRHYVKAIEARYNRDDPARAFSRLPREAQAAIVSLLYQRGNTYPRKVPELWACLQAGEWQDAALWLEDPANGDGYHSRRKREGLLLAQIPVESGGSKGI